ncbi:MAG TPA: sarcosine oxidase subunit gamma family protein [Steroidobacteraceae bacterium]|nr:sarcosine oxidase subunit gamma family protein [Steroidobacteraceae bacterium]
MSVPESAALRAGAPGIALASCPADIVELVVFRGRASELERLSAERSITLPSPGGIAGRARGLTLSVRPGRWLLLAPPAASGASALHWQEAGGCAAVVDLSSALVAFFLEGPAVREMLARACRLDLDAGAFPVGRAAATIMVQVPAILARLTPGMLLLTPATTAQHLREWLVETSRPFGLALVPDATVSGLCGESST